MKLDKVKIGKRLAKLRGEKSQREVAEAIGVEPMAISYYESGQRMPRDEIKIKIAEYYGTTVYAIFFAE